MAELYAALGERDEAFAWLERAFDEKSQQLTYLNSGAEWDPLRSDPRFQDLVRRIGLPHRPSVSAKAGRAESVVLDFQQPIGMAERVATASQAYEESNAV